MDPNEQLCAAYLRNAEINKRIPIQKLNEYKAFCQNYGYDEQFDKIINDRILNTKNPQPLSSTTKILLPTNKIDTSDKIPISSKTALSKVSIPNSPKNKHLLNLQTDKDLLSNVESEISEISKLPIKLPESLWNWEVKENEPPIPIKYPVRLQYNILLIEKWRHTIAELSLVDHDLYDFSISDLRTLFDLYNLYFFNNSLPNTKLEISNGLTVTAGVCKISKKNSICDYNITISRSVFEKLNLESNQVTKSGGLTC